MTEKTWWLMIVSHQVGWASSRAWLYGDDRVPTSIVVGGVIGAIGGLIIFVIARVLWAGIQAIRQHSQKGK